MIVGLLLGCRDNACFGCGEAIREDGVGTLSMSAFEESWLGADPRRGFEPEPSMSNPLLTPLLPDTTGSELFE